jgi:hypothetical protein
VSTSSGEAALKGLGKLLSQLKKAMDQPEPNLYPLRGRLGCPIFNGKISDLAKVFGVAR